MHRKTIQVRVVVIVLKICTSALTMPSRPRITGRWLVLTLEYKLTIPMNGRKAIETTPVEDVEMCKQYAQLGARGVSILYASGDSGVGCPEGDDTRFQPTFPSNCPLYVSYPSISYRRMS